MLVALQFKFLVAVMFFHEFTLSGPASLLAAGLGDHLMQSLIMGIFDLFGYCEEELPEKPVGQLNDGLFCDFNFKLEFLTLKLKYQKQ